MITGAINPGSLRDLISIQNRAAGTDGYGQANGDWADVHSCCAQVEELSGRELVSAREISAEVSIRIVIRGYANWRTQLTAMSRLVFGERVFEILSVLNPDGRNNWLHILATEIVPEGS